MGAQEEVGEGAGEGKQMEDQRVKLREMRRVTREIARGFQMCPTVVSRESRASPGGYVVG